MIGTIVDVPTFLLHGFVPLAPVLTSVGLAFYYLQQGGVCYTVSSQRFGFTGCELCDDGYPPIDGMCHLKNGTSVPFEKHALISLYNTRLNQTTYCAADHPEGPQNVNFCFFGYSGGSTLDKDEEDFAVLSPTKDPSQFLEYVVNQP